MSVLPAYTKYNDLGLSDLLFPITKALEVAARGDYYEFGLYAGCSFHHAQVEADRLGLPKEMNFWGFDSFQGIPQATNGEQTTFGAGGNYACDRATVERLHNQFGVDWSRVHLIEGWYDDTLTKTLTVEKGMKPASVVLVDCDLYQSTVPVLKFIEPLLQDRTIIIFDDWGSFGAEDGEVKGEKKAFREFLLQHPEWFAFDFMEFNWATYRNLGKAFCMVRK